MTNETSKAAGELSDRLRRLGTACLSDALDRMGIDGVALGLRPLDPSFQLVGRAFTVRMLPRGLSGKSVGDYIDDVAAGEVVVIDNAARVDATVWGDILTSVASARGIAGTVIDGVCRDGHRSLETGYPVYARSRTMRTGKDRVAAEEYGGAVQIAGIRVEAGDWLRGDGDGVIVLPASQVVAIVEIAEQIAHTEDAIVEQALSGVGLRNARAAAGYHQLQTADADGA